MFKFIKDSWKKCTSFKLQILHAAILDTFWEYTMHTRVSGIWLLQANRTKGISRWFWSSVMIILFLCGVHLSLQLWLKFYSYPILNTISQDLPITDVAFPGVTICSSKVVNVERVRRYIKTLVIPSQYNMDDVADGFEFLYAFTDLGWKPLNNKSTTYRATDAVLRYNNISIYEAALQISAGCEDFAQRCFWGDYEFNCRQVHEYLSFKTTTSFLGPCCSFNYNPRNLSYVPLSSNMFGIDGALTFIGVEGSERNLSTGLIVLVHHPMDFVTESTTSVTITSDSESFLDVLPTVQSSSKEVLELSERKRDCLISNDLALIRYRQASCMLACQSELIMEKCKCQPYHLPNGKPEFQCQLKDWSCYSREFDTFKSAKCEHCLPNCYDVTYDIATYKTDLMLHNYSISRIYSSTNFTKDTFIVRVYLSRQVVPAIHKVTVMSWVGLLSDLGGVFSLCLGLSMVSVVEFFYYITYRLNVNYKTRRVLMH